MQTHPMSFHAHLSGMQGPTSKTNVGHNKQQSPVLSTPVNPNISMKNWRVMTKTVKKYLVEGFKFGFSIGCGATPTAQGHNSDT